MELSYFTLHPDDLPRALLVRSQAPTLASRTQAYILPTVLVGRPTLLRINLRRRQALHHHRPPPNHHLSYPRQHPLRRYDPSHRHWPHLLLLHHLPMLTRQLLLEPHAATRPWLVHQ